MTRVRITGGPWPERIGAVGTIVGPPEGTHGYPWAGLDRNEIVVLLDNDPFGTPHSGWTCVLGYADVEAIDNPKLRSCAVCGTKSLGWWCSYECYRSDEGETRRIDDV